MPCPSDVVCKWLVEADVDGLTEGGAAASNVLHLHPELLDPLDDGSHHEALAEPREEEGHMQGDLQHVDDEPLLTLLKDVAEQCFVDHCQLAQRA